MQNHRASELLERGKEHFDTLYREGAESARFMAIALHPYLIGVPFRIGYLDKLLEYIKSHSDVMMMTGSEILDWYDASNQG